MKRKRSFLDAVSGSASASGSSSASATASTAALCVCDKVEEYSGGERWQMRMESFTA